MVDEIRKDSAARPDRIKGRFAPGHSGNRKGRPQSSKNLKTYLAAQLAQKVTVTENGKSRTVPKVEAIAIQLVAMAARGDPKGIAAVMALVRDTEQAATEVASNVLARAEDLEVVASLFERLRAAAPLPEASLDFAPLSDVGSNHRSEPARVSTDGSSPLQNSGPDPSLGLRTPNTADDE